MAEQGYIDFEALADMAPPELNKPGDTAPVPTDANGFIDFEALSDVPQAGATLAKHRWQRLKKPGLPVMGGASLKDNPDYEELTAPPTPTPLTNFEQGVKNKGLLTGVNVAPTTKGLEVPYSKQDIKNPVGRAAANLVPSAVNLVAAPIAMAGGVAQDISSLGNRSTGMMGQPLVHPFKTAEELATYIINVGKSSGKAGIWAIANSVHPGLGATLQAKGLGPEQFVDMITEDPIGVSTILLGGIEGARQGGIRAMGAENFAREGGGVPRGGDFDFGNVPIEDPIQQRAQAALIKIGQGKSAADAYSRAETPTGQGPEETARDQAYTTEYQRQQYLKKLQEEINKGEYDRLQEPELEDILPSEPLGEQGKPSTEPSPSLDTKTNNWYKRNLEKLKAELESDLSKKRLGPKNKTKIQAKLDKLNQDFPSDLGKLGLELQPQRSGPLGSMLEPTRPIVDFRNEYPLAYDAADLPSTVERGSTVLQPGRVPKVAGIREIDARIKKQFYRLGLTTKKGKPRKGGTTLGMGLGGAQDFLERRGGSESRQLIKDVVEELKSGGFSHNQAIDEVYRQRKTGVIDGPTESALLREVSNAYVEKLHESFSSEADRIASEHQAVDLKQMQNETLPPSGKSPKAFTPDLNKYDEISFTPAGEQKNLKGEVTAWYFTADRDLPGPNAQRKGSKLSEEAIKAAGVEIPEGHKPFKGYLKKKESGTVLGSGLGGAQDLFDNLSDIGIAHLQLGLTDYGQWSDAVRRDAQMAGVHVTDAMLQQVWNGDKVRGANPRPPANQAIANSLLNNQIKTTATEGVGQPNTSAAQAILSPEVGTGPTSMQAMTNADHTLNIIRDIWQSDFGTASGLSAKARKYFPRVHEQATHFVTSRALAFLKSRTHVAELRNIFSEGGKAAKATTLRYMHDFSDLIADDRARGLDARNAGEIEALRTKLTEAYQEAIDDGRTRDADEIQATIDDVGPATHQIPKLDDAKHTKLLNDPKIQSAIEYWHKGVKPQIDNLTANLDIQKRLTGPLGLYVKFRQLDFDTARKMQRTRPIGEFAPSEHNTATRTGAVSAQSPWNVRPGYSGSAKRATGNLREGMSYENDVRYMLEHTYSDRLIATTKNSLREAIREAAILTKNTNGFKPIPKTVMVGGKPEPLVGITFESKFGPIEDTYYVPQTIAEVYNHAMHAPEQTTLRKAWDLASSVATTQVVLLPAEAVRHGFNAISAVVNSRFYHQHGPLAELTETFASAATLGLSKMATAISRAYKLEGPELAKAIEQYGADGALRLSGYEGTNVQRSVVIRAAEHIPGIHALKDLVFGDPGSERGFTGLETRLRIVLGETIKSMEPNLSDHEVAAKINDAYGTYVTKLEPQLTTLFRGFDPFARAGIGLTRSGVRLIEGRGVTGKYSSLIHAQVAGTLTAIAIYNKLLDDDHKWPWEHPDYKIGDIMLARRNGKTYRLGFADLANGLKRGSEFTGLTAVGNAIIRGERAPSVLASEWTRGISNAYLNRASPLLKALNTLRTGKAFTQSPSGDLYSTAKPAMTGSKTSPMGQRIKAVATTAIPVIPKAWNVAMTAANPILPKDRPDLFKSSDEKLLPDSYIGKVAYGIQDMFSIPYVPQIGSEAQAERAGSEVQDRIQQEWAVTIRSIAREAMNLPDDRRFDYIQDEIDTRISDEIITELGNPMPGKIAALKSIISMIYRAPAYNAKTEALQGLNQSPQSTPPAPTPP